MVEVTGSFKNLTIRKKEKEFKFRWRKKDRKNKKISIFKENIPHDGDFKT